MKVFGVSVVTILIIVLALWVGRKWGSKIPLIGSVG
jgi:hypothetical protein